MNTLSKPTGLRTFVIIIVIALLLLGGIGITGAAAQSAVPGDALYSVKTSIEQTRLSVAKDAGDRAQMKLSFAEQRLEEISMLVNKGLNREIKSPVLSFEASINGAIIELETVAKDDPTRAAELAKEITSALTRYAQTLSVLAAKAPDSFKDDINRALGSTQLAGSLDMPTDDNSNSSAHDFGDDHGNDNANSISSDQGEDLGDDRGNDNANVNSNENGDDHGNDNGILDANDKTDDSSNSSTSVDDNSNSSTNTGVDDNSNSNTNTTVDDNSNSSTNADDSGGHGGNSGSGGGSDDNGGSNGGG
jgi:uncharacterized membrane protein YgcG